MVSILYVDDEPDLLALGKLFLEQDGSFSVDILPSAREALLRLESKEYDAIISDFQMPEMNGIEFLQRVRASGNTLPFIIFTGRSREEIVIQALNEGADFYIQKGGEPVSQFAELANKVKKAVVQRRAEASIRDHERREADIINFLPDATFAIDTHGVVIAWNRAMERMTGVRSSEILGKGSYEYAIPFYHERHPILIDLVLTGDPSIAARYPSIKRDGKTLFSEITIPHFNDGRGAALWFTASPLYTMQGSIAGAIESIREVTERKKAQAALVEKTQELDRFFETNLDLLCIADTRGYFRKLNPEWEKTLGYTLAELEGHCIPDFVHPDDLEATRAALSDLDQNKDLLNFVNRFRCKDGSYRWIEWRSSSRGKVIYAAARDITARKEAENVLRQSEQKYRTVFETTGTATVLIENDATISLANTEFERLSGYTKDEIVNKKRWTEFVSPEDLDRMLALHRQRRTDPAGALQHYEFRFIPRSGEIHDIWLTIDLIPGTTKSVASLLDITERKRAEERLITANQEYSNLLSQIQDIYYRSDNDGRVIKASQSWATLLGYADIAECLGRNIAEDFYFNPEDRKKFLDEVYRHGKVTGYEVRLRKKDGTPVLVATSSHLYYDNAGNILGVEGTFRDITGQKLQDHILRTQLDLGLALQENRGLRDTLTLCLDAAIGISGMDAGGIYLVDETSGDLVLIVSRNVSDEFKKSVSRYSPDSENARTIMAGKPIYVQYCNTRVIHPPVQKNEGLEAAAVIPISCNGRIIACLNIASHSVEEIPADARIGLETIAVQIGAAIGRLRADEALRESEERYRNVVEDQTEFISRFLPDGTHVFVNEAYCRYFGLKRSEILGHRFRPAIPPGDQERLKRFFSSLTPDHPVDSIEHRIIMPDRSVRWQRWSDRGIFDPAGTLIEYQSVGRDITEHKRSEEELRAVQEKYAKAFLAVPDAITISDLDSGRFIEVNDAATALFGYSRDELIGKSASELGIWLKEEDRAAFIDQLIKHGRIHGYEVVERRKSGELYDALVNADTLTIGGRQYFIAIVRDITERKRTERAIGETARKIEILTSITRHDVANQVSILRGFARLALKQKPGPGIAELLLKIDTAGSMIARQIAFTRTYQELGIHAPGWYRISEIVAQQKTDGISLSCTCYAEIFADPMIERVFFNLFENAVRHGERVTGVTVRCCTDNGRLVITFEDDGVGILADLKETIFEKGYGRNTGFGLFLAREILAITGIAIHETGTPGAGARFEIAVPAGTYRIAGPAK